MIKYFSDAMKFLRKHSRELKNQIKVMRFDNFDLNAIVYNVKSMVINIKKGDGRSPFIFIEFRYEARTFLRNV